MAKFPADQLYTVKPVPMSRRDRFAAAALAGLLANSGTSVPVAGFSLVAALAVKISDATIAELDKPQT